MFTKIHNKKIEYIKIGQKGEDVLFIHGLASSYRSYLKFLEELSHHLKVWAVSCPGAGRSFSLSKGWKYDNYEKYISEFCKKMKIKPHIIGHSYGGGIALQSVVRSTYHYKSLILISPLILPPGRISTLWGTKCGLFKRLKFQSGFGDPLINLVFHPLDLLKSFLSIKNVNLEDEAKSVEMKTSIIWGKKDSVISVKLSKKIKKLIEGSKLFLFKNADHYILQQYPKRMAKFVYNIISNPDAKS